MAKATGLTKHQIEIITKTASEVATKHVDQKEKRKKIEQRERNLQNTNLLLKNYTKLRDMAEEYQSELSGYDESVLDLETLTLETLEKYHFKTVKIMRHVDAMLRAYELGAAKGLPEEKRRFEVLKYRYLVDNKLTVKQLCERLGVEQATVYRDSREAINDMSVMLFGVAAIGFV
ncbi:hypothetical protein CKN61_12820 [Carnobacterium divergens]|uniref:helix-turn-helix domain-containing protein n=1 Tax=Carnobacterium divergens TaxID=2748 RepID=UPI0010749627|nr:helix-turn-helix domain-containing protein [Carnobacterium divergens]MDT1996843.1 helix-turn-helix domain-containing protein [Carnobacterium divergens]TFI86921.1 hypothetical protein CKN61_12820 [Carnobacterium divergens]